MTENLNPLDKVKPRQMNANPRCPDCKSDDVRGGAPMFHPAHRSGPCEVRMPGGDECGSLRLVEPQGDANARQLVDNRPGLTKALKLQEYKR